MRMRMLMSHQTHSQISRMEQRFIYIPGPCKSRMKQGFTNIITSETKV